MAELVLSGLLPVLFEKLASAAVNKIAGHKGIDAEIKKWQRSLKQIQRVLADASRREIDDESVKEWLNELRHLAYDIDDVLDDLAYEAMDREFNRESEAIITSKVRKLIPNCCSNFSRSTYKLHDKLDNISVKLQDLVKEKTDLGLRVEEDQTRPRNNNNNYYNRRFESCVFDPSSIVGRQAEKEELVRQLLADGPSHQNFSVVPIVGMGGVGKTTLAKLLYAEKQVNDHFELKAWVCVSDVFDIFGISKAIFKAVAPEVTKEFTDFNLLHVALTNQLRGKRFLLVLDDVWNEDYDDWKRLVEPFYGCNTGSKITYVLSNHISTANTTIIATIEAKGHHHHDCHLNNTITMADNNHHHTHFHHRHQPPTLTTTATVTPSLSTAITNTTAYSSINTINITATFITGYRAP